MSGHTPGPWTIAKTNAGTFIKSQVAGYHAEVRHVRTDQNAAADARLISAAPDLLDAVEGLLNALPSATTHPQIKAARAAIAKATGGA